MRRAKKAEEAAADASQNDKAHLAEAEQKAKKMQEAADAALKAAGGDVDQAGNALLDGMPSENAFSKEECESAAGWLVRCGGRCARRAAHVSCIRASVACARSARRLYRSSMTPRELMAPGAGHPSGAAARSGGGAEAEAVRVACLAQPAVAVAGGCLGCRGSSATGDRRGGRRTVCGDEVR